MFDEYPQASLLMKNNTFIIVTYGQKTSIFVSKTMKFICDNKILRISKKVIFSQMKN